ncbi:MAG TPA: murein biosynthesis integral membrane protein MurJ [Clostridiaceae bacterium]|nr:murein biosynthesis integral membrane protein MurJ [Clostridiaceae bacterium]
MKKKKLSKDLSVMTIAMMVSLAATKVAGFVREILIVPSLGYGVNSDAYTIGFQIPDLFYQMLVGGAISAAIVPLLSSAIARGQTRRFWKSLSTFITVLTLIFIAASLIGIILAPHLIGAYNTKQPQEVIDLAAKVSRALFPQTIFMMLSGVVVGVMHANKAFHKSLFHAFIYNIVCIFFIVFWGEKTSAGPVKVAFGVVIAAFVQFMYVLIRGRQEVKFFRPTLDLKDPGFKRIVRLGIPTLLSGSVMQINAIVQTHFAHQFPGAVTALRHINVTRNLPLGIMVVAIANMMLPILSEAHAKREYKSMRRIYTNSLRRSLYLIIPFTLIFFVLSQETIQAIFQWGGAIPENNLAVEGGLLQIHSISMAVSAYINITTTAFYARKITRISILTSVVSLALNPILCVYFANTLGLGLYGIPVANIVNEVVRAMVLGFLYKRHIPEARPYRMLPFYLRTLGISIVTVIVLMGLNTLPVYPVGKLWQLFWYFFKVIIGLLTWYFAGLSINLREAIFVQKEVRRILGFSPISK